MKALVAVSMILLAILAYCQSSLVAIADYTPQIIIMDASTCTQVITISNSVLLSPIGSLTNINSTTFAALSNNAKVAFFSWSSGALLDSFDTGHTSMVTDMAYFQSSFGEQILVTCSRDRTCKVFKWTGTMWTLQLNFISHTNAVNVVTTLSNDQIASGGWDFIVRVWDYQTGYPTQTYYASNYVLGLAQVSSNLIAIAVDYQSVKIWCFTNNTLIKESTIPAHDYSDIVALASTKIVVGANRNYYIFDWVSGVYSNYSTSNNILYLAVTSSMLSILVYDSYNVSVRNVLDGSNVCTKQLNPQNPTSVLAQDSIQLNFSPTTTTSTTTRSTTTTTIPVNNIDAILASLPPGLIDFSTLTTNQTISLLASGLDVSDCLVNCSTTGACIISNYTLVCKCYTGYAGPACHTNLNSCASSPCLNNGTCLITGNYTAAYESNNQTLYTCECSYGFYGSNCEIKVNLCENVTCSGNGKCQDMGTTTKCNCFYLYSGNDCEIQSKQKATIQTVMSTASIIAIVMIVMLYLVLFLFDLSNLSIPRKRVRIVRRVTYVP